MLDVGACECVACLGIENKTKKEAWEPRAVVQVAIIRVSVALDRARVTVCVAGQSMPMH